MIGRVLRHSTRILRPSLAVTVNKRNGSFFKKYVEPWYPPLQPTPDTYTYRQSAQWPGEKTHTASILVQIFIWYWIMFHFYYDWHTFVEYGPVYPDPKDWTDEELGIPPDDAD